MICWPEAAMWMASAACVPCTMTVSSSISAVAPLAAYRGVVAGPAVESHVHRGRRQAGGIDDVIAAEAVEDQGVVAAFGIGDRKLLWQPIDRDRRAVGRHDNVVVDVACIADD